METPSKQPGPVCPECGQPAECFCRDVGGVDYTDEYTLVCREHGKVASSMYYGGSPYFADYHTNCPYCGETEDHHSQTPEEFW